MSVPDMVDWYRQEVLPMGGDHELQFAVSVLGHIQWGTSQQRCRDKRNRNPYHLRCLLDHCVNPAGPRVALRWVWLLRPCGPPGAPMSRSGPGFQMPTDTPRTAPSRPATLDGHDLWLPAAGEGQPDAP